MSRLLCIFAAVGLMTDDDIVDDRDVVVQTRARLL